jgi:pimeloyl-ACP methyl ester carboxylesterase
MLMQRYEMPSHPKSAPAHKQPTQDFQAPPYTSRFIDAGGLRLHYLDYGTPGRPPMVCLHGGGAHAHWFDPVAAGFAADYHVMALDQRGHGDSAWTDATAYDYEHFASDLSDIVEALDLREFVLIGHSMGGNIALIYAAAHPERLDRLVVVDSTMNMSGERVAAMREVGARQGRRYATREEFVTQFRVRPAGTYAAPEIVRHMGYHGCRQTDDGGWRHKFDRNVYATRNTVNTLPLWDRIRMPALLVKGGHSHRITPAVYAEVKARAPHVELAEVPDSDHHVTLDNPAGFVHAVTAFLARHT